MLEISVFRAATLEKTNTEIILKNACYFSQNCLNGRGLRASLV